MEVKTTKISDCKLELTVSVPREKWDSILKNTFSKYQSGVKLDGFRKGKVPLGMIKKMYGPAIEAQAAEDAVRQFYVEAVDQENIDAIAPGDISDVDFSDDNPFTFKATVEIMPEFEIQGLDDLKTFQDEVDIADDDVEAGIEVLRHEHATISISDEPANEKSVITADIQEVDQTGVPLLTHNWKDVTIEIGKNAFGPDVDEQLLEKNAGDEVTVSFKNEEAPEAEKKEVFYRFNIKEIKTKELPEIDEEFAQSISPEFDDVDKLHSGVKEHIVRQANSRARVKMFNRLVEYLIENNRIEVPPSMLEGYLEKLLANAEKNGEKIAKDDFKQKYEPSAIRNLKWFILRKNLIEQHQLHATEDEIDLEIDKIVQESGGTPDALKAYFKNPQNKEKVVDDIEERKVLEYLESTAKITRKKIDYKEFVNTDS